MRAVLVLACALLATGAAWSAQGGFEEVEVSVSSVAGSSVYLDQGRDAGIEAGDMLRLSPIGGELVLGTIRSVSTNSSRAELRDPGAQVEIGSLGVVLVPRERLEAQQEEAPQPRAEPEGTEPEPAPAPAQAPEHPPWEAGPEAWKNDVPLLAPISARKPEERAWRARGRVYHSTDYTRDSGDVGQSFLSSSTGVDMRVENPFRRGGELEVDVEHYYRSANLEDGSGDAESVVLPHRLSYRWGGTREAPERWEVGRFLQHEFPEFGVVDGVEYTHRFSSGSRAGASLGFFPEPRDQMPSWQDLQAALFYRFVHGENERLALGIGYQKTWHNSDSDRDLLVGTFSLRPTPRSYVYSSLWVDYYNSTDTAKGQGFEITQFQVNANKTWDRVGAGVFASHFRFPQLLRNEFNPVTAQELSDNRVSRVGLNGWVRTTKKTRLNTRFDLWEDEDDNGGSVDLRYSLRDVFYERGEVAFGLFGNTGAFSSGRGGRVSASRQFDAGTLSLGYDVTNFEQRDFNGTQQNLLHHGLLANFNRRIGEHWDLSIFAQDHLRPGQNSFTIGVTIQRRF